jgi:hypothetical protein
VNDMDRFKLKSITARLEDAKRDLLLTKAAAQLVFEALASLAAAAIRDWGQGTRTHLDPETGAIIVENIDGRRSVLLSEVDAG